MRQSNTYATGVEIIVLGDLLGIDIMILTKIDEVDDDSRSLKLVSGLHAHVPRHTVYLLLHIKKEHFEPLPPLHLKPLITHGARFCGLSTAAAAVGDAEAAAIAPTPSLTAAELLSGGGDRVGSASGVSVFHRALH